ncbi:MAG: hypothetical protein J6U92_05265 [Clostridia bacterium]|nr:hypothetical protein [Clostridia bacterium]
MPRPTGAVHLCANAIIDNSYSNTIDFKTPSEQLSYWGSLVKYTITDFMYIRRTHSYIKVDKSLTDLDSINYLYFRSDDSGKVYFCFVTSKEYISESASYIYFETDVLQSYMFDYEVKQSYVLQEHVDRWSVDHKPIFSRTAEGLDYGSEYTLESAFNIEANANSWRKDSWYLVSLKTGFTSTAGMTGKLPSEFIKSPSPYVYLLIGGNVEISPLQAKVKGANRDNSNTYIIDIFTIGFFQQIMANTNLGSFVHQIVRLPYLPFDFVMSDDNLIIDTTPDASNFSYVSFEYNAGKYNFIALDFYTDGHNNKESFRKLAEMDLLNGLEDSIPTAEQWAEVKANPYSVPRDKRFESKLLTYPYRYNLLTDWKNQPLVVKNEYVGSDKLTVNYLQWAGFNAPARYWVDNYRKDPEGRANSLVQVMQEDLPISTDAYYTYMLQNRNQLQADKANLQASNITAMTTALTAGVAGGLMSGKASGLISGIAGGVMGAYTAGMHGETNYQNMVRSQNAVQRDLRNLPDTVLSSNDGSFNMYDDNRYISLYRMKVCCEFEELLADTFATSGYTVKRVKVPNLRSRLRYNYIKTVGANIVGSFNQDDLAKIKAIFNNGVTFWHYNTVNFKPYDYSLENIETSLI